MRVDLRNFPLFDVFLASIFGPVFWLDGRRFPAAIQR
jgi:hypothetical protein